MSFSSKIVLILAFGFIFSSGVQAQIYFPEDLLIDPLSYQLKYLKISKIEQYSLSKTKNDTTFRCFLNYVIKYDSNQVVKEFLDDFMIDYPYENFYKDKGKEENESKVTIKYIFSDYYCFVSDFDSVYYRYRLSSYFYNKNRELDKIEIKEPFRFVLDGVYNPEYKKGENFEVKSTFENKLIKKEEYYKDGNCYIDKEYFYKIIQKDKQEFCILDKVIEHNNFEIKETYIKYFF